MSSVLIQEPAWETDATAPSTTAGPVLVDVPELLVPAPPEFLCTWVGIRVEFREGFTDSSAKEKKHNQTCKNLATKEKLGIRICQSHQKLRWNHQVHTQSKHNYWLDNGQYFLKLNVAHFCMPVHSLMVNTL